MDGDGAEDWRAPSQAQRDALAAGDSRAEDAFVRAHLGWMIAAARRILREVSGAEDAAQNAFIKVFAKLDTYDGVRPISAWMRRIVINEALMILRSRPRSREQPIDALTPEYDAAGVRIEAPWGTIETPEALLQRAQIRERVLEGIDLLPESYRTIIVLRDLEEYSTKETAEALAISETNAKVRLNRARGALKKLMEPLLRGDAL